MEQLGWKKILSEGHTHVARLNHPFAAEPKVPAFVHPMIVGAAVVAIGLSMAWMGSKSGNKMAAWLGAPAAAQTADLNASQVGAIFTGELRAMLASPTPGTVTIDDIEGSVQALIDAAKEGPEAVAKAAAPHVMGTKLPEGDFTSISTGDEVWFFAKASKDGDTGLFVGIARKSGSGWKLFSVNLGQISIVAKGTEAVSQEEIPLAMQRLAKIISKGEK